jgi:hypothetical protein
MADFQCPICEFVSRGWATQAQAAARGAEHANEHETGELMTELTAFEASVGFVRPSTVAVVVAEEEI